MFELTHLSTMARMWHKVIFSEIRSVWIECSTFILVALLSRRTQSLSYNLRKTTERTDRFMALAKVLMQIEMQISSGHQYYFPILREWFGYQEEN